MTILQLIDGLENVVTRLDRSDVEKAKDAELVGEALRLISTYARRLEYDVRYDAFHKKN